ncbi:MAG TPA: ThiF family adenylyltransferase [Chloroflexota bacterium]|nr:ThiF family adenylyltransferase [Chloroflexota bacterium]
MERELERYSRQILFSGVGEDGQRKLCASRVLLVGCGALGSNIANTMVRAGVGKITIVDRDFIEMHNLQRQTLFDEEDVARSLPKSIAAAEKLRRINSQVDIVPLVTDVNPGNIEQLVGGADIVLDGTDNFETRYLINDACIKLGKPWVYGGVVTSGGTTMTIIPHETACLRCVFPECPPSGSTATADTAGILASVVSVIASLECAEAIKLLVGAREQVNKGMTWVDVWDNSFLQVSTGGPAANCLTCAKGEYQFLIGSAADTTRCGRQSIQFTPTAPTSLSFPEMAARIGAEAEVHFNEYMLRLLVGECEVIVFRDGRTMVKGTSDEDVARGLYRRYVSMERDAL